MTEADFMKQVTDLATIYGYSWAHFRPAQTAKGWRTPVSGTIGKGFPDLVLAKAGRVLFVELKVGGKVTPEQEHALVVLGGVVWTPADFDAIQETLSR